MKIRLREGGLNILKFTFSYEARSNQLSFMVAPRLQGMIALFVKLFSTF